MFTWIGSGDFYPATRSEYESIKAQLEYERTDTGQPFHELPPADQAAKLKQRMKTYCQRVRSARVCCGHALPHSPRSVTLFHFTWREPCPLSPCRSTSA